MSVSLALIPVVLALRVAMGKEGFENWIRSQQVRVPTSFEHEVDLIVTVRKCGYDAEKWAGSVKTHIRGEREFFFWELIDGVWTAVFSKADSREMITRFMQDVENRSNRKIFVTGESSMPSIPESSSQSFPTNFLDEGLLLSSLEEYGLRPSINAQGEILCRVENSILRFSPVEGGPYSVEIENAPDLQQVFGVLSDLDEDYKRSIQATTYEKLLSRINEKNLLVESEEVLDDNSIMLTLNVRE